MSIEYPGVAGMLGEKEESEGGDISPRAEENPSTLSCSLTHLSYEEQEDFWETLAGLDVFITFTAELNFGIRLHTGSTILTFKFKREDSNLINNDCFRIGFQSKTYNLL